MELIRWVRLQWDRALGVAAMVVGVVLLVVGWVEVSGTEFVSEQIPYVVSAGLGGLVALLLGGTLWLSADLRDEWRALNRIDERLRDGDERSARLEERVAELESRIEGVGNGARSRRKLTPGGER